MNEHCSLLTVLFSCRLPVAEVRDFPVAAGLNYFIALAGSSAVLKDSEKGFPVYC